jgi:hypothetical protein
MRNGILLAVCMVATGLELADSRAAAPVHEPFPAADPVATDVLARERGREGGGAAQGAPHASLGHNTAVSTQVTTYNVIDRGAFAKAGGFVSVVQNTGNNVIIQDSTVVNVTITP